MTCKDCVHYEACRTFINKLDPTYKNKNIILTSKCERFQNKADFVNVIKCKDCKYCECIHDQFDNDWYFCTKSANNAEVKADDFCSYGKRKEEG